MGAVNIQLLHRRAILTILCSDSIPRLIETANIANEVQNRKLVHTEIIAGEIGLPTPKEQPPRKLSGKRIVVTDALWKEARVAPADGITFSGKHTEGAPIQRRDRRQEVLQCGLALLSFLFDRRDLPTGGGAHERSASNRVTAAHAAL